MPENENKFVTLQKGETTWSDFPSSLPTNDVQIISSKWRTQL